MTTPDKEAEAIAAGLTEAQRNVLDEPYGYVDQFDSGRIRRNLIAMGLIESGQGLRLTPLGLSVRRILQEQSHGR